MNILEHPELTYNCVFNDHAFPPLFMFAQLDYINYIENCSHSKNSGPGRNKLDTFIFLSQSVHLHLKVDGISNDTISSMNEAQCGKDQRFSLGNVQN